MSSSSGKIFFSFIFVIGLLLLAYYLIVVLWLNLPNPLDPSSRRYRMEEIADKDKIQYRLSYGGKGSLKQSIHLNSGQAYFGIGHKGNSGFKVQLTTPTDSLIVVLCDVIGEFDDIVQVNIPKQDAYLLSVITTDEWKISYR